MDFFVDEITESRNHAALVSSQNAEMTMSGYREIQGNTTKFGCPIRFGDIGELLSGVLGSVIIILDETVANKYPDKVRAIHDVTQAKHTILLPSGEASKQKDYVESTIFPQFREKFDFEVSDGQGETIIGIGGGVVSDVAGVLAGTANSDPRSKGVRLVQVPTTLLNMVDAAITQKSQLNVGDEKNAVGVDYFPNQILVDFGFLEHLPDREMRSGIAEMIKLGLTCDLCLLCVFEGDYKFWTADYICVQAVKGAIESKLAIMKHDIEEFGAGRPLIYGHEVGHAIETLSGGSLNHGESISIGMSICAYAGRQLMDERANSFRKTVHMFQRWGLPIQIPNDIKSADIADNFDVKHLSGPTNLILNGNDVHPDVYRKEGCHMYERIYSPAQMIRLLDRYRRRVSVLLNRQRFLRQITGLGASGRCARVFHSFGLSAGLPMDTRETPLDWTRLHRS